MRVKRKKSVQHQNLNAIANQNDSSPTIETDIGKNYLTVTEDKRKSHSTANRNAKNIALPDISPRGYNGSTINGSVQNYEFIKIPTKSDILKMSQI